MFRFIMAQRSKSEAWHANGHRLPVGHFQIDSIDPAGNIAAGCHTILWNEIERIARQLKLI